MKNDKIKILVLAFILIFGLAACGQTGAGSGDSEPPYYGDTVLSDGQFAGIVTELETIDIPENLPIIPGDYDAWARTDECLFFSYVGDTKIFAHSEDTENLYLLWDEDFIILPWGQLREAEEEVLMSRYDADRDRKTEIFAICDLSGGSNNYVRQVPHIIDKDIDGKYYDIEFPVNDYWDWVCANTEYDSEELTITFKGESFSLSDVSDTSSALSAQLSYFYAGPEETDNYSGELIVAVTFTTEDMKEVASLTSMIGFNGKYFEALDHMIACI